MLLTAIAAQTLHAERRKPGTSGCGAALQAYSHTLSVSESVYNHALVFSRSLALYLLLFWQDPELGFFSRPQKLHPNLRGGQESRVSDAW